MTAADTLPPGAMQPKNAPTRISGYYDIAAQPDRGAMMRSLVGTAFTSYLETAPILDIVMWTAELP